MGRALGNVDSDFMAERNQPLRADVRQPLEKRKGRRS